MSLDARRQRVLDCLLQRHRPALGPGRSEDCLLQSDTCRGHVLVMAGLVGGVIAEGFA